MNWTTSFLEVIDFRSFSNIWYWIIVAVAWSQASYYVMGVPFDVIQRARRTGEEGMEDLESSVRVSINRVLFVVGQSGLWMAGFVAFFHTMLLVLAFWYGIELALALALIVIPLTVVGIMSLMTARRIVAEQAGGERIIRLLLRQRFWTQVIGMISIFVTATLGMYNLLYVPNF